MRRKPNIWRLLFILSIGALIGSNFNTVAGLLRLNKFITPSVSADVYELQDKFIKIGESASQAVVGISVSSVVRQSYSANPYQDEFFRFFFGLPERQFRQSGIGSGFIVDPNGYILTNEHVINQADDITVILPDGRKFKGVLTGYDIRSDLAVIKIDAKNLPYIEMGDSDKVKTGQWAIAVGNPFAIFENNPKPTMTLGIVSAIHRTLPSSDMKNRYYGDLIQTDASINPGNSGGPLLDINGKVIGINVAILSRTGENAGIGFALPVNQAKRILNNLISGKRIEYGWIGVAVQDLSQDLLANFGLKQKEGVIVAKTLEGAPADKAGILRGDIITKFDGVKIASLDDLINVVGQSEIGKKVKVEIIRSGKKLELPLVVEENQATKSQDVSALSKPSSWRGLYVQDLTDELKQQYQLQEAEGVLITQIDPNSPALYAKIQVGDVIDEIDRKPVKNVTDFNNIASGLKGDILVHTFNQGYVIIRENKNSR